MASYEKRDTTWSVRFRCIENGSYVQKRLSGFRTKKDAELGYLQFIENNKLCVKTGIVNVRDLTNAYLQSKKSSIRESSYICIESIFDKHVLPYLSDIKIKDLTPQILANWQSKIANYSYRYIKKIRMYLNAAFEYGERMYGFQNLLEKVDRPRDTTLHNYKVDLHFWTYDQFQTFLSVIDNETYYNLFNTLYLTGMRKGEALALQWSDLQDNYLHITKSNTHKTRDVWRITQPKNASSIRNVSIPSYLKDALLKYRGNAPSSDFIFKGKRPLPETSVDRAFHKYSEMAKLPRIRIHDLRHSHASYLISKGLNIVAISQRLGHSSVKQTLDTYAHMMPQDHDYLLDCLEKKDQVFPNCAQMPENFDIIGRGGVAGS